MKISKTQQRALLRLERKAHRWAELECSYQTSEGTMKRRDNIIMHELADILGAIPQGFFLNGDPRCYALKIDPEKGSTEGLATDWGGYGLLAHPDSFQV